MSEKLIEIPDEYVPDFSIPDEERNAQEAEYRKKMRDGLDKLFSNDQTNE
ncbi:Uncharacterised protein [Urinicoccus massiliensis]|uniref:Uncharacterized protein n=1 Tax=Urinicoccus massiliensis TaxID=1723382 RepID=A0A8H2M647_9FIRM|nr:hypothetical protein [Urinicoccus massiliensis]VFB17207.1 Uncharacterised protein [Urinicoccus massiliensis]